MPTHKVTIGGKQWTLVFTDRIKDFGDCDVDKKRIRIKKDLSPKAELETLIHELLHAQFWVLDEDAVNEASIEIAAILTELGYR